MQKLRKVRENIGKNKEKVKRGVGKVRRKAHLIKPILLVDGITIANAMFGLLSIFASISGYFKEACYLLLLAALMDYLDGKFARRLGRETALGMELDSLADIVSFGVAPAVLGFVISGNSVIAFPIILFVSCGIIRLAKFNVQLVKGYYFGMPITMNGIIFPVVYFASVPVDYWFYIFIIAAVLMVSPFKIRKVL